MISTARIRARQVLHDAGLGDAEPLERASSAVNEVWYAGDYVVRISHTPGTRRLEYEAQVAAVLPESVRYPELVTYGRADFAEWLIARRVPGQVLSRAWPTLTETERRDAVEQLGAILRELHHTAPPTTEDGRRLTPPFLEGDSLECPHQLPVARLLTLVRRAARLPHVDRSLLASVERRVRERADAFDDAGADHGLVHGDLHFENVLWHEGSVTAVLDFEWARQGPPDLDLDVLLRFCADPSLHVASDYRHLIRREDYRQVPSWLRHTYPELFAHPRLNERLYVYCLSYDVRALLLDPPRRPPDELSAVHPQQRIRALLDRRAHLPWIEW